MTCSAMHLMLFKQLFAICSAFTIPAACSGPVILPPPRPETDVFRTRRLTGSCFFPVLSGGAVVTRAAPECHDSDLQASSRRDSLRRRARPDLSALVSRERLTSWIATPSKPDHVRVVFGPAVKPACRPRLEHVTPVAHGGQGGEQWQKCDYPPPRRRWKTSASAPCKSALW